MLFTLGGIDQRMSREPNSKLRNGCKNYFCCWKRKSYKTRRSPLQRCFKAKLRVHVYDEGGEQRRKRQRGESCEEEKWGGREARSGGREAADEEELRRKEKSKRMEG